VKDGDLLAVIAHDPDGGIRGVIDRHGDRLLGRLHAHALNRGYGDAGVEDVFQEVLLSLLDPENRAAILARGGEILPWLSRLGYWRMDDAERRRRGSLKYASANPVTESSEGSSDAARAVRAVVQFLSPRDRDILKWRYEDRLANKEVAARLGITEVAAKKAAHDARERLKSLLLDTGLYEDRERG
jgi:RNA polymerase sigma factor (sigma-70 family)